MGYLSAKIGIIFHFLPLFSKIFHKVINLLTPMPETPESGTADPALKCVNKDGNSGIRGGIRVETGWKRGRGYPFNNSKNG